MSWFNIVWTKSDYAFVQYSKMMNGSGYDPAIYTFEKFQSGKRTPLPVDKRQAVYNRCWKTCEACWNSALDDIHHIDRNPSNHNLDNLIGVCRQCHISINRYKDKKRVIYDMSYGGIKKS